MGEKTIHADEEMSEDTTSVQGEANTVYVRILKHISFYLNSFFFFCLSH